MDKRLVLFFLIVAWLFVGTSAGTAAHTETESVIVGVPRDFYPEYAIGPDDRPEGFGVDVMNTVAKRAGLRVTYRVFATWSETLTALERGDIDIIIPVVVITPARESRLLFTRPYLTSPMSVFVRRNAEVEGMADLAGRRVGGNQERPGTRMARKGG